MSLGPLAKARVKTFTLGSTGGVPIEALGVVSLDSTGGIGSPGGGSTQVSIKEILTSSGASVMDSTASAIKVNIVAGSASSTQVTVRQSTAADLMAAVVQGSTVWPVQVSSVSGVVAVAQNSTTWAVQLTQYSTTANISSLAGAVIVRSSAADMNVTAAQASTTWAVQMTQYSTTMQVSSLGGAVIVRSTAGDLNANVAQVSTVWAVQLTQYSTTANISSLAGRVMVDQNSTTWQTQAAIRDSSGTGFVGSVTRPTTGAQGLVVRHVLNDLQSTAFSTLGNGSTSSTLVSSVASQRIKVYAYSITSTVETVNSISFASSLANPIWTVQMRSLSSAISGVNLAVTPPAWLFATEAASPLVWKCGPSTGSYHVSVSWFTEA